MPLSPGGNPDRGSQGVEPPGTADGSPLASVASPGSSPMLDIDSTYLKVNVKSFNSLTPQEKRLKRKKGRYYHCLLSGLEWNKNEPLYFLTLTSREKGDLGKHWNNLVVLIRQNHDKFEYCKLETSEGNGVLHVVFTGSRLDVSWLRRYWKKIHNSPQLRIDPISQGTDNLRKYLLRQYLASQDAFVRFSCSKNWIYPGYRDDFLFLIRKIGYWPAIAVWDQSIELHRPAGQVSFDGSWILTPSEIQVGKIERREVRRRHGRRRITRRHSILKRTSRGSTSGMFRKNGKIPEKNIA